MTLQQIDSIGDEFEAALRNGDTTLIEDFLPKVEESQRSALLKELLEIEVQFAVERSDDDSLRYMQESLKKRFPDQHPLIQSLFQQIVPLRRIGDYEIIGELGRGGMGIVYKAKHKLLQQTVAIKVLSQALLDDSQAVGRFKREMQLIGGLTHQNIVRALNAGEIDNTLYLAMEFVNGITLQKLVEFMRIKNGETLPRISLGAACEAIRQAALGLQEVYELKLVHRDIKPANLMLDHRGTVKILDLGLGKFAEEHRADYHSSLTMAGMVLGTVDYIAPEQCENSGEADIRSDLYSLGCSLYFLLTGKPVYSGSRYDTMRKKLMAHIVGEVPSLQQIIPGLPKEIESILQKILAKDPAERFQTPLEFADALTPFTSPEELWTLMQETMPADATAGSGLRHSSSPHIPLYATKKDIAPPVNRTKWIILFTALNLLLCGLIAIGFILYTAPSEKAIQTARLVGMRAEAKQFEENGKKFWEQWKMAEAQTEYQKATRIRWTEFTQTNDLDVRKILVLDQFSGAMAYWYCGDSTRARAEFQSLQNRIDDSIKQEALLEPVLSPFKMLILERLADITLFGVAASDSVSDRNRERFTNAISRYNEATKIGAGTPHYKVIRWKQAILYTLLGNLEEAEKLLKENPVLPNETDLYATSVYQLAEAVVFYYQRADNADRDEKLRAFQRQFALPSNALREAAMQPENLELLLFCGEFLIHDSIKHEDWKTLGEDFSAIYNATGNFLRQYPGATPFMRRFNELLVRSAVLLHDHAEQARDKRRYVDSIARLLERMRLPVSDSAESDKPTLIYFFLPESNKSEEGFVLFYPQDERSGTFYRLPLTRQIVKQGEKLPPLDEQLLQQIAAEKALQYRLRVSWDDSSAWAHGEDALTEKDYPYGDVLPLR